MSKPLLFCAGLVRGFAGYSLDQGRYSAVMAHDRIGHLPPKYSLLINAAPEMRLTRCPHCNKLTYPRKFALLIGVEDIAAFVQGKTCKYCSKCRMILVQQDELEFELAISGERHFPEILGHEYLVVGVVEIKAFKEGMAGSGATLMDTMKYVSDIRKYYDLSYTPGGWFPKDYTPPVVTPRREQRVPKSVEAAMTPSYRSGKGERR